MERLAGVSLHKPLFLDITAENKGIERKVENDTKVYLLLCNFFHVNCAFKFFSVSSMQ